MKIKLFFLAPFILLALATAAPAEAKHHGSKSKLAFTYETGIVKERARYTPRRVPRYYQVYEEYVVLPPCCPPPRVYVAPLPPCEEVYFFPYEEGYYCEPSCGFSWEIRIR